MTDTPTFTEVLSRAIPADGTTIDQMRAALWDTPAGRTMINKGDVVLYWLNEADVTRAALAAAPQPAPDRESLMEMIAQAQDTWSPDATTPAAHIADALLARGLRLPGDETMAWALVGDDEAVLADTVRWERGDVDATFGDLGPSVRVAIRVVEGGDDE